MKLYTPLHARPYGCNLPMVVASTLSPGEAGRIHSLPKAVDLESGR
jgi:hypothetical protein